MSDRVSFGISEALPSLAGTSRTNSIAGSVYSQAPVQLCQGHLVGLVAPGLFD
jgi:hypothetical protein